MAHVWLRGTAIFCLAGAVMQIGCGDDDSMGGMGGMSGTSGSAGAAATTSCTTQMFDKYGADAFVAVRDSIVTKALAAPTDKLGDSFQVFVTSASDDEVQAFKDNLAALLIQVYGGPQNYMGRSMQEAHKGLGITSDQYDYFITEVVVPALSENGVSSDDISNCFAPPVTDASFKASIVGQ
ncbi:MAG TPA: hypothetical protein VMI54_26390 [Polyangiaceae bacterium]|nr:hypothetical protein [Polyangiaceae bacterium]